MCSRYKHYLWVVLLSLGLIFWKLAPLVLAGMYIGWKIRLENK